MIDGGLRKLFQKHLPQVHWQPVETGLISAGVPDINYCYEGLEGWIECKKSTSGGRIGFRPEQIGWIKDRLIHGGRVKIAVLLEMPPMLVLFDGPIVYEWKESVFTNIDHALGLWVGRHKDWDWDQVLVHLTKEL